MEASKLMMKYNIEENIKLAVSQLTTREKILIAFRIAEAKWNTGFQLSQKQIDELIGHLYIES